MEKKIKKLNQKSRTNLMKSESFGVTTIFLIVDQLLTRREEIKDLYVLCRLNHACLV